MMGSFWQGRRVFITGHTGFKGAWLCHWLHMLGAKVTGFALTPPSEPSLYALSAPWMGQDHHTGDIRDLDHLTRVMAQADPQIILHMAAQALVRRSYADPVETYATNVLGTVHVLQAARGLSALESVVVVTSDKVYENTELGLPFVESDRLGGHDPYSNSKACTELVTQSFRDSFFAGRVPVATARAGNVIGGGDWAVDRLIPDIIRALGGDSPVVLRNPGAIRPWQHVLEPLSGYLALAQSLATRPDQTPLAVNFGPHPDAFVPVSRVVEAISSHFDGRPGWRLDGGDHPQESHTLTLAHDLARDCLNWQPRLSMDQTLDWTAGWYRDHLNGGDAVQLTRRHIELYQDLCP